MSSPSVPSPSVMFEILMPDVWSTEMPTSCVDVSVLHRVVVEPGARARHATSAGRVGGPVPRVVDPADAICDGKAVQVDRDPVGPQIQPDSARAVHVALQGHAVM